MGFVDLFRQDILAGSIPCPFRLPAFAHALCEVPL